jgi:hypothetical protein
VCFLAILFCEKTFSAEDVEAVKKLEKYADEADALFSGKGIKVLIDAWGDPDEIWSADRISARIEGFRIICGFYYIKKGFLVLINEKGKVICVDIKKGLCSDMDKVKKIVAEMEIQKDKRIDEKESPVSKQKEPTVPEPKNVPSPNEDSKQKQ